MLTIDEAVAKLRQLAENPETDSNQVQAAIDALTDATRAQAANTAARAAEVDKYARALDAASAARVPEVLATTVEGLGGTSRLRSYLATGEVSMSQLVGWVMQAGYNNPGQVAEQVRSGQI